MTKKLPFRYIAISSQAVCPVAITERVQQLDRLGVDAIQIRDKETTDREKYDWFEKINCTNSLLFVNGRADFTRLFNLAGVQRGTNAISSYKIRSIIGSKKYIGYSAHNLTELRNGCADDVDFILYSPIFPTESKPGLKKTDCHGLEGLKTACRQSTVPVFALGGVGPAKIKSCLQAGAFGAAGIRALFEPPDPQKNWSIISSFLRNK